MSTFVAHVEPDPHNYQVWYWWENEEGKRQGCITSYARYVSSTRSNPQWGDRLDVTVDGRILGLHPEYTDGN